MLVARLFTPSSECSGPSTGSGYSRRRMAAAVVPLATAALLLGAGCSSGDNSNSTTTAATTSAATGTTTSAAATPTKTSAGAAPLTADDEAAITTAFTDFFAGSSSAETKLQHLQDSANFAQVLDAQAGSGLSASTTASVSAISGTAPGVASVTYTIEMGGTPVLADQTGVAVQEDGQWKVSASTFCDLLTLQNAGVAPAECADVKLPAGAAGD